MIDKEKFLRIGIVAALVFFTVRHYTKSNSWALAVALPGIPPL